MSGLIVIEGTSNSGKTTTCDILRTEPNFIVIPEFMKHPRAPRPSKNIEEELANQRIFLEIEKERMKLAKIQLEKDKLVFLERSYLSIVAVSYAFEKLGKYESLKNAQALFDEIMASEWFINPSAYYILSASHEEISKRNKSRTNKLNEGWIMSEFDGYQKEYYDMTMNSNSSMVQIDTTKKEETYAAKYIKERVGKL